MSLILLLVVYKSLHYNILVENFKYILNCALFRPFVFLRDRLFKYNIYFFERHLSIIYTVDDNCKSFTKFTD